MGGAFIHIDHQRPVVVHITRLTDANDLHHGRLCPAMKFGDSKVEVKMYLLVLIKVTPCNSWTSVDHSNMQDSQSPHNDDRIHSKGSFLNGGL